MTVDTVEGTRSGRRRPLIVGAVIGVILLAGCLSTTVEVTVREDGMIERMDIEMEMDVFLHERLDRQAQEQGYDSLEESFLDDMETEAWDRIEYEEEQVENTVFVTITAHDGDPDELRDIDVTVTDSTVTFVEHNGFAPESFEERDPGDSFDEQTHPGDHFEVEPVVNEPPPDGENLSEYFDFIDSEYIVHMPGEVTETNGEVLDNGSSVRWDLDSHEELSSFEATSERPRADPIPGFGLALGIGAVLLTLFAARRWSNR